MYDVKLSIVARHHMALTGPDVKDASVCVVPNDAVRNSSAKDWTLQEALGVAGTAIPAREEGACLPPRSSGCTPPTTRNIYSTRHFRAEEIGLLRNSASPCLPAPSAPARFPHVDAPARWGGAAAHVLPKRRYSSTPPLRFCGQTERGLPSINAGIVHEGVRPALLAFRFLQLCLVRMPARRSGQPAAHLPLPRDPSCYAHRRGAPDVLKIPTADPAIPSFTRPRHRRSRRRIGLAVCRVVELR
ncbi:hypothetical protein FB451DRAFT_1392437 [Mycena latifolia]|nr:hypothetical protein FB451DRAFT_1392437 [Mycena latifolia]